MKEEYGGLLHQHIPVDGKGNLKIADIGTGTWSETPLPCIRDLTYSYMLMENNSPKHLAHRTQPPTPTNRIHRRCRFITGTMPTRGVASEERHPDRPRCLSAVSRVNGREV